jgi:hypothetical protein
MHASLLCAVVQIALQPEPFGVGCLHQPGPRGLQLQQPRAQLRLQRLVLQRKARGCAHRADQFDDVLQGGVVQ